MGVIGRSLGLVPRIGGILAHDIHGCDVTVTVRMYPVSMWISTIYGYDEATCVRS